MVLRQVVKHAFREEILSEDHPDPMRYVESAPPKDPQKALENADKNQEHDAFDPSRAWTRKQVASFREVAQDDRDGQILLLLLGTGLRRGEGCGLQWKHVDFRKKTLRVAKHLIMVGKAPMLDTPKTKGSKRVIPLADDVVELLKRQKIRQQEDEAARKAAGEEWAPSGEDYVFRRADGRFLHPDGLRRVLARLAAVAKVDRIRIHELRDTYVTLMARRGVKMEVISKLVGHSDPAFTLRRYRQVLPDEAEEAVLSLNEMLTVEGGETDDSIQQDGETEIPSEETALE